MSTINWVVVETTQNEFNPTQLQHKETVFTLSNGYLGTRGSFEEGYPNSCPATLINGVYDDAPVVVTELPNCPDWTSFSLWLNGCRFRLNQGTILKYQRWLNLYTGVLSRRIRWKSPNGETLDLQFERFVSLADEHVMALRCQVQSVDFNGTLEVHAGLNGYPDNHGLTHWVTTDQGRDGAAVWLQSHSRHSKIELGMAARLDITGGEALEVRSLTPDGYPMLIATLELQPEQQVIFDKCVTVFTSRDTEHPLQAARQQIATLPDYLTLRTAHEAAWAEQWAANDIVIEGDSTAQLAVRYNLFQLLSATPRHDDRVSIPAKTLSGFVYRGHIFWDTELFILPCLTLTQPDLARNLLTYRYHTLAGARRKAQAMGHEGAFYAWESATTGDEVTPTWVPDPLGKELVRIWCGEIALHISTDVAYAVWQYWQTTGDDAWMCAYGAEMVLDTAVFWGSRAEWNAAQDRYEIRNVLGPDEFHDRIDNNAFTNRLTQWHLKTALKVWTWLRQEHPEQAALLEQRLDLTPLRLEQWREVIQKLWVPRDEATGLIEQFEGFFALEDIDLQAYEPRSLSMQAILGIEGASQRQVLKQADVLMLLYLLRKAIGLDPAEPDCDRRTLQANWDYYEPRTDHVYGSSLGPPIHAILACELGDRAAAYEHFMRSALVDLADVRSNAREGIHAASTGGVWQTVIFGFAGLRMTPDGPVVQPQLPEGWRRLKFQIQWHGQTYAFDLQPESVMAETRSHQAGIEAVIFDLDGVLTDTSEFHYQAWKRLADEAGLPFDRQMNEHLRGVSRRESLQRLLQGREVSEADFEAMMARKNQYYLDLVQTITPQDLLPGVADLLAELRAAGIKIALGSSSKNAPEVLQRLGIAAYMDAIADGNSVTQSKPAPDVFLHAARQLEVNPIHCVVVEDASSGIEAAMRAGMWSIGLGPTERVGDAHVTRSSLEGVHWADLIEQLAWSGHQLQHGLTIQQLSQQQNVTQVI